MNWETGLRRLARRPDWSTLRVIPWLEKTALVLADVQDEATGALIPVAPRTMLAGRSSGRARWGSRS